MAWVPVDMFPDDWLLETMDDSDIESDDVTVTVCAGLDDRTSPPAAKMTSTTTTTAKTEFDTAEREETCKNYQLYDAFGFYLVIFQTGLQFSSV